MRGKKALKRTLAFLLSAVMAFTVLASDANVLSAFAKPQQQPPQPPQQQLNESNSIVFRYYTKDAVDDTKIVSGKNVIKYTIDFVDEQGNPVAAEKYPKYSAADITKKVDNKGIAMEDAVFNVTASIPSATFKEAYFGWTGYNSADLAKVIKFYNAGEVCKKYKDSPYFQNYLGYSTARSDGADYNDPKYMKDNKCYAYDSRGTLHVIYTLVTAPSYTLSFYEELESEEAYDVTSVPVEWNSNKKSYDVGNYVNTTKTNPTKEGYNFVGWGILNDNGILEPVSENFWGMTADGNVALYAIWEETEVIPTVTYVADTKIVQKATPAVKATVDNQTVYKVPAYTGEKLTNTDHDKVYWSTNGTVASIVDVESFEVKQDTTLYAIYGKTVQFYVLKDRIHANDRISAELKTFDSKDYTEGMSGVIDIDAYNLAKRKGNKADGVTENVAAYIIEAPTTDAINAKLAKAKLNTLTDDDHVEWYVIKTQSDGIHVDGAIINDGPVAITVSANDVTVTYGDEIQLTSNQVPSDVYVSYKVLDANRSEVSSLSMLPAGTYTIVPVVNCDANKYAVTKNNGTLTVNRKSISITGEDSKTYDGKSIELVRTVSTGTSDGNLTVTLTNANKDCDTYAVTNISKVEPSTKVANYEITANIKYTINKIAVTVTADSAEIVKGQPFIGVNLSAEVTEGKFVVSDGIEVSAAWNDPDVLVVANGSDVLAEGTLERAIKPVVSDTKNYDITYVYGNLTVLPQTKTTFYVLKPGYSLANNEVNGFDVVNQSTEKFIPVGSGTFAKTFEGYSFTEAYGANKGVYNKDENGNDDIEYFVENLPVTAPANTLGSHKIGNVYYTLFVVDWYVVKDTNQNGSWHVDGVGTWTAVEAPKASFTDISLKYNGADQKATVIEEINKQLSAINTSYAKDGVFAITANAANDAEFKNVTDSKIVNLTLTFTGLGGLTDTVETSVKVSITPATAYIIADDAEKTYGDADPETLTVKYEGLYEGDTLSYTIAREAGENVGEYPITVTADSEQGNYLVETRPGKFVINPVRVKENVVLSATKTYGDADPDLNTNDNKLEVLKALLLSEEDAARVNLADITISRVAGENVGTYDIVVKRTVVVEEEIKEEPEQEEQQTPNVPENEPQENPGSENAATPIRVQDITPAAAIEEVIYIKQFNVLDNYIFDEAGVKVGTFEITKRTAYVVMHDASKYVGDADPRFVGSVRNLAFNDSISIDPWRITGEDAGTYEILPNVGSNANYNIEFTSGTLTIIARQAELPTPPVAPPTGPTYTPVTPTPTPTPVIEEAEVPPTEETVVEIPEEATETPQAAEPEKEAAPEVVIEEEAVPEAAGSCWIHWLTLGLTLIYAIYATARAVQNKRELDDATEAQEN